MILKIYAVIGLIVGSIGTMAILKGWGLGESEEGKQWQDMMYVHPAGVIPFTIILIGGLWPIAVFACLADLISTIAGIRVRIVVRKDECQKKN